jgi:sec-independent protein translocase protein TatC
MATALKPIAHDARLTLIDHLDELRTRLLVCAATLAIAFAFCFWQNHALLNLLNQPLIDSTPTVQHHSGNGRLAQVAGAQQEVQKGFTGIAGALRVLGRTSALTPAQQRLLAHYTRQVSQAAAALPKTNPSRVPITTGVTEPFTVTLTVAAYFALLLSLPVLLYQAYAFVLPAFSPHERRVALPLMLMAPLLFVVGVAFGYELVVPPAIRFLQNFNDTSFDVLIQAKPYYSFVVLTLLATGLAFQLPIGLLGLNAAGILSAAKLRQSWRYAIVGHRPHHHDDRDGTAAHALRPEYPAPHDRRSPTGEPRGARRARAVR